MAIMSNSEFEFLMKLNKQFIKKPVKLPDRQEKSLHNLKSITTNDMFLLDIDRRCRLEFSKIKMQERNEATKVPLVRIDIDAPPHMNPDGTKTSRNHIHIYQETENDTGNLPWAYDLSEMKEFLFEEEKIIFVDIFLNFCKYCHIVIEEEDKIQGVMFDEC